MANIHAIHSVGHSLVTYLKNSYPADLQPRADFKLLSSGEMNDTDEPQTSITLYLYRVTVNEHLRNAKRPNDPSGSRPPLSLDLHYLLSVWAANALDEHTMLGWALDQLHRHPVLDVSALSPEAGWSAGDFVQLIPAELSTEDIMRIWDALAPSYRISVSYIARVLRIEGQPAAATTAVGTSFGFAGRAPAGASR
jgi:hypothetical protein